MDTCVNPKVVMRQLSSGMFEKLADLMAHPAAGGIVMAIIISILRVFYDADETSFRRILLESMLCGALTLAGGSAFRMMGYGPEAYMFCGGAIGFMGSQSIRVLAYRWLGKKAEESE